MSHPNSANANVERQNALIGRLGELTFENCMLQARVAELTAALKAVEEELAALKQKQP